ncbi:zinc ribbon domain-containing protein [Sphingomonas sp. R86521]|uniref:zinc ribbon domain-containing protein n=1 Tax=Sphingomonas sp. R86521 TaxID=3093860 RepID=UPI0036D40396
MIGGTKPCPRCAERVKAAAQVCRYCGHEFGGVSLAKKEASATEVPEAVAFRRSHQPRRSLAIVGALVALALVAVLGWAMSPKIDKTAVPSTPVQKLEKAQPTIVVAPAGPALQVGESLEWTADQAPAETVRMVGDLTVRVSGRTEDDTVAPLVTVSRGDESVTMTGESVSSSYTHRISSVRNIAGAPPVVMLQSFSGGAHCCNHVQLAGISGGRLKIVDLGSWDGDEMAAPTDLSGDGLVDFVERDNAFLYAFAPYAMSAAPPEIFNVTGGRVVDVSRRPAFRRLYVEEMEKAGETCRTATDGMDRNGSCPAFVASAARVGRLNEAWADMVSAYAADQDWEFPTGCSIRTKAACPESSRIVYKSYPEALLAFLKEHGYVAAGWSPPDATATEGDVEAEPAPAY